MNLKTILIVSVFLLLGTPAFTSGQTKAQTTADRREAFELIKQNRYLDALPLLKKIAATDPTDGDFWAYYSFAVYTRSQTLESAEARQTERLAALLLARKAEQLGSKNRLVLQLLETIPSDGGNDKFAENADVNQALQEGEAFFGRGEFEKALTAYQRALKLDPKNYEATVFAGDTFFARRMYAESESWFAKAANIAPDREIAYRFWGDALRLQGKSEEAIDKYVEALIAEPNSRLSQENIIGCAEENDGWNPTVVTPPGGKPSGEILFDEAKLKTEDGTRNWLRYRQMRELWQKQLFKKEFPAKEYRHTLREEAAALRIVAEAAKSDLQKGNVKTLDENLVNLIKINDAGLLEAYILFVRPNDEISEDYVKYRETNRNWLRRFITEFLIGAKKPTNLSLNTFATMKKGGHGDRLFSDN